MTHSITLNPVRKEYVCGHKIGSAEKLKQMKKNESRRYVNGKMQEKYSENE
jgi:hypothetical protein